MTVCTHCEEDRISRCSYADCPFEVEQANETITRLQEQLEAVTRERDEARETNRRLNRRVQRWEGNETSFRLSFEGWSKILFATKYDRANHIHDFIDWQRQIDKAWANGRAEAAEARAARLEAALRRIIDMCPATQEMTVAHMMADEAAAALDVKEAG